MLRRSDTGIKARPTQGQNSLHVVAMRLGGQKLSEMLHWSTEAEVHNDCAVPRMHL